MKQIIARSQKAADVRKFIQKLNMQRGLAAEAYDDMQENKQGLEEYAYEEGVVNDEEGGSEYVVDKSVSRWSSYERAVVGQKDEEDEDVGDDFVTMLPDLNRAGLKRKKRRRVHGGHARGKVGLQGEIDDDLNVKNVHDGNLDTFESGHRNRNGRYTNHENNFKRRGDPRLKDISHAFVDDQTNRDVDEHDGVTTCFGGDQIVEEETFD